MTVAAKPAVQRLRITLRGAVQGVGFRPFVFRLATEMSLTGFEPLDILEGILMTATQLEEGRHEVENQYIRAVRREGNRPAQERIAEVFEITPRQWRGLGEIPASGFQLRGRFQKHDANLRYPFSGRAGARVAGVHQRTHSARHQEASRVPGFRRGSVRRRIRSALPWYRRKAHARPITTMADVKTTSFNLSCPVPRVADDRIVLAHGGGGRLTHQLIEKIFLPAFSNAMLEQRHDGAVLHLNGSRLAFTTDSFVVRPLIFPGGDIGDLAVNGTVNDLAMCGARPLYLSSGFILEEGLEMETLRTVVKSMQEAAANAGVQLVTGDTKVVDKGKGDGIFVNAPPASA